MSLLQFQIIMPKAVQSVVSSAGALRDIRDGVGELHFRDLNLAQQHLHGAKINSIGALTEGQKATVAAEAFMQSLGGPATLGAFAVRMAEIEAKASAWNARLKSWLETLPSSAFVKMVVRSQDGIDAKHIGQTQVATEMQADPLRSSVELADLIAAFEAVGA